MQFSLQTSFNMAIIIQDQIQTYIMHIHVSSLKSFPNS